MKFKFPYKIYDYFFGKISVKIAQIENPELLFDELLKKDAQSPDITDEQIPYWAEIWPSSIALSEYIAANPGLVKGKKIIELGCGLSMPGIVAGKFGAEVLLTDYLKEAIDFAEYNWSLNFDHPAKTQLLDWRNPKNTIPADVILASDVAYESRLFDPLISLLKKIVKQDGIILISEPNRKFAKTFTDELKKSWTNIFTENKIIVKDGIKYTISVYQISGNQAKN